MVSVFNSRNLIYIWVLLTAFVLPIQQPTRDLANTYFRNNQRFATTSFPFSLADGITRWIDDRSQQIVKAFQFDPSAIVLKVGNTTLLDGQRVGFLLILLLLVLAVRFYMRAVASPAIFDDILALIICFFVYHLVAETFRVIKFAPNAQGVTLGEQMIAQRSTWVWFLAIVILAMVLGGKGWIDAKVFWKGTIELFFVWLFLIPQEASKSFAALLDLFAAFGGVLTNPANVAFALIWAVIGLLLAVHRLYNAQPAGGGFRRGGDARSAGGHGGGGEGGGRPARGGLLGRLSGKG